MRFFFFVLLISYLWMSCENNNRGSDFVKTPTDSVFTTVHYSYNWTTNDYRVSTARRVALDTFALTPVDSLTSVKKWRRDSIYYLPFADSVTVKGKVEKKLRWVPVPKGIILIDYNKNWK